jgi:hypothetical protein
VLVGYSGVPKHPHYVDIRQSTKAGRVRRLPRFDAAEAGEFSLRFLGHDRLDRGGDFFAVVRGGVPLG